MKHERNYHVETEAQNTKDKAQKKDDYETHAKNNLSEVDSKEKELKRDLADLSESLEFTKKHLIQSYEGKMAAL